jgi:hypothetical protein
VVEVKTKPDLNDIDKHLQRMGCPLWVIFTDNFTRTVTNGKNLKKFLKSKESSCILILSRVNYETLDAQRFFR